ncbi:hypothetical protein ACIBVL_42165 [Streptomyces sp. NPDC049687]|uniref:hypothetical protein n=1 Tax=Streptomyces sp. NPDC049687 TaxID=3365596 RepID=UPI0037B98B25
MSADVLFQEHLSALFPAALRGAEPAGVDLALLDVYIAGCVSVWQSKGGSLDPERLGILRECLADLDRVLPLLTDAEGIRYFERLRRLAVTASA